LDISSVTFLTVIYQSETMSGFRPDVPAPVDQCEAGPRDPAEVEAVRDCRLPHCRIAPGRRDRIRSGNVGSALGTDIGGRDTYDGRARP